MVRVIIHADATHTVSSCVSHSRSDGFFALAGSN
jgi:hypothetical protein